jgi:saccharopine dehydrogenase-like NADP-dependent oxidoreductase
VKRASARASRVAVVGGAGAMGRIIVRDLAETAAAEVEIIVADRDVRAARALIAGLRRRVKVVEVDARFPWTVVRAVGGAAVLINACHHDFNLRVMDAALALGSHYCDLGGLFHVTRRQLRRDREFRRAGLLALCGIGSAPGIVNVMARAGADRFDRVSAIHIAVGTSDRTRRSGVSVLETSYSIQTVLDEASQPAALFRDGALWFVEPLSHAEPVRFPSPIGLQYPACTLHSELATLPQSFREKGIRDVSFKIAFPGNLTEQLRLIHALGLTDARSIAVRGRSIVPRDVLLALLSKIRPSQAVGPKDEYEVLRVTVCGQRRRGKVEEVLDCLVPGMPRWGVGVDIDTGAPPSITAQMLLAGAITARGVHPPERAVPPDPFFRALEARNMRIKRRTSDRGPRTSNRKPRS